ncbi:MAG: hypothetical protein G01um101418_206 [Parcubacteria group bacterium Gr01-1014_18]|nr:MAG: hypothetical protein Greene041636_174 [Parcubacteria group bacterium Greene0416_36]TSC81366.1 MAG: hypothetical protein G01um101418_206 [Parcubacteria group bacterium Gr01-1014_18]TSC99448.1 MAG: hypothetical protein Greene101420_115 [Parcubacteria group bacterium Greene1014_20]TSD07633.1 MAG: hypothetical protein Greene07142_90 [Parcubacteria group bacterium Greene0714_2]
MLAKTKKEKKVIHSIAFEKEFFEKIRKTSTITEVQISTLIRNGIKIHLDTFFQGGCTSPLYNKLVQIAYTKNPENKEEAISTIMVEALTEYLKKEK